MDGSGWNKINNEDKACIDAPVACRLCDQVFMDNHGLVGHHLERHRYDLEDEITRRQFHEFMATNFPPRPHIQFFPWITQPPLQLVRIGAPVPGLALAIAPVPAPEPEPEPEPEPAPARVPVLQPPTIFPGRLTFARYNNPCPMPVVPPFSPPNSVKTDLTLEIQQHGGLKPNKRISQPPAMHKIIKLRDEKNDPNGLDLTLRL